MKKQNKKAPQQAMYEMWGSPPASNDETCPHCGTDHRDENYSLVPCIDSIIGTICVNEVVNENS